MFPPQWILYQCFLSSLHDIMCIKIIDILFEVNSPFS